MADDAPATDAEVAPDVAPEPELLHGAPVTYSRGQKVAHPTREQLVDLVRTLRDDDGYVMCLDLAGVDYLAHRRADLPEGVEPERFEVVVTLISHAQRERLRLRVQVPESDPVVPTLFEVHPGTDAMEREVFDMFGIAFDGHPDLTRILMPEDWHGHPLRKDYAVGRIPVQFKDAPSR
ncbi:NADH-quinone oxidoreductase subunit C [Aquihabitans sp. G128]|uniref:NADH-quinone oxidoreductase subunit C n=1 Tax=Aquihabitans sp. G128 TaxID=2849779 RepID=UPI0020B2E0C9|nr:NADH-quinone oxidoreductase subunit C [Aquihabitans sp. G128]